MGRLLHGYRISIHAPREGSDPCGACKISDRGNFNPRSPRGERHCPILPACKPRGRFQSTLPARGATWGGIRGKKGGEFQSTLPARGATYCPPVNHAGGKIISIHAPREGSDCNSRCHQITFFDFNPRSPRGERRSEKNCKTVCTFISIHAPREGSDLPLCSQYPLSVLFQSTLPARGATTFAGRKLGVRTISIHAPREGSDPPT